MSVLKCSIFSTATATPPIPIPINSAQYESDIINVNVFEGWKLLLISLIFNFQSFCSLTAWQFNIALKTWETSDGGIIPEGQVICAIWKNWTAVRQRPSTHDLSSYSSPLNATPREYLTSRWFINHNCFQFTTTHLLYCFTGVIVEGKPLD